jgi:hypothetical protein
MKPQFLKIAPSGADLVSFRALFGENNQYVTAA